MGFKPNVICELILKIQLNQNLLVKTSCHDDF